MCTLDRRHDRCIIQHLHRWDHLIWLTVRCEPSPGDSPPKKTRSVLGGYVAMRWSGFTSENRIISTVSLLMLPCFIFFSSCSCASSPKQLHLNSRGS